MLFVLIFQCYVYICTRERLSCMTQATLPQGYGFVRSVFGSRPRKDQNLGTSPTPRNQKDTMNTQHMGVGSEAPDVVLGEL